MLIILEFAQISVKLIKLLSVILNSNLYVIKNLVSS